MYMPRCLRKVLPFLLMFISEGHTRQVYSDNALASSLLIVESLVLIQAFLKRVVGSIYFLRWPLLL